MGRRLKNCLAKKNSDENGTLLKMGGVFWNGGGTWLKGVSKQPWTSWLCNYTSRQSPNPCQFVSSGYATAMRNANIIGHSNGTDTH